MCETLILFGKHDRLCTSEEEHPLSQWLNHGNKNIAKTNIKIKNALGCYQVESKVNFQLNTPLKHNLVAALVNTFLNERFSYFNWITKE